MCTVMQSEVQKNGRQAILVLGMHRSGTSAVTRVLNLLGAAVPKTLLPTDENNPRGYWESERFYSLHDQMLQAAGSCWYDWRVLNPDWFSTRAANGFRKRIRATVISEYDSEPLIVLKDPRICRFLPYLLEILAELEIKPLALHAFRNPLGVVQSLERRDGLPIQTSLLLWLRYVLDAEFQSRHIPRCFISYENLLADWRTTATRVASVMGLTWPHRAADVAMEIDEFLSTDLRHEASTIQDLRADASVVSWVKRAFNVFVELENGNQDQHLLNTLDTIRAEFDEGCHTFGPEVHSSELLAMPLQTKNLTRASDDWHLRLRVLELERGLDSFGYLFRAIWRKVIHLPRDLSRKLRGKK